MSSGVHRLSVAKSGATRGISGNDDPTELARPRLEPIDTSFSFKNKAYLALKSAIVGMDVYGSRHGIRLDERSLAQQFGTSRTLGARGHGAARARGLCPLGAAP